MKLPILVNITNMLCSFFKEEQTQLAYSRENALRDIGVHRIEVPEGYGCLIYQTINDIDAL